MAKFQQDSEFTPVIFRKYGPRKGGDVIALLPAELGTYDPYMCSSYVHVGQHGSADPNFVIGNTRPALPHEYADLKRELESPPYGYRFQVYNRLQRSFLDERKRQLGDIR